MSVLGAYAHSLRYTYQCWSLDQECLSHYSLASLPLAVLSGRQSPGRGHTDCEHARRI